MVFFFYKISTLKYITGTKQQKGQKARAIKAKTSNKKI